MAVITTVGLIFFWLVTAENRVIRPEDDAMNRLAIATYFFWPDASRELAMLIGFVCYALAAFFAWLLLFSLIDIVASTLQARTNEKTRNA